MGIVHIEVREMPPEDLARIGEVDRSERVTLQYLLQEDTLGRREVDWEVPRWPVDGPDGFSVRGLVESWDPILVNGGTLLGAFAGINLVGFAIHRPDLSPGVSELVALYVDRGVRRRGVAGALVDEVEKVARRGGAKSLYVSATPSESAVGFYLSRGFRLARCVNAELAAREPEDIQMERLLQDGS